jgi:hypothetical protein
MFSFVQGFNVCINEIKRNQKWIITT